MGYYERNTWTQVATTVIVLAIYIPWTLSTLPEGAADGNEWLWRMMWVIMGGVGATIVGSIIWGIVAGARKEDASSRADERDIRITQAGERVGQAFLVLGGIAAIVMCAMAVHPFWIAQTIFAGFALSALIGGIASLIMYRVGMP